MIQVQNQWATDPSIYPVKDVKFYLDAAELPYRYTLHWKLLTPPIETVQPLVPVKVNAQINNQVMTIGPAQQPERDGDEREQHRRNRLPEERSVVSQGTAVDRHRRDGTTDGARLATLFAGLD